MCAGRHRAPRSLLPEPIRTLPARWPGRWAASGSSARPTSPRVVADRSRSCAATYWRSSGFASSSRRGRDLGDRGAHVIVLLGPPLFSTASSATRPTRGCSRSTTPTRTSTGPTRSQRRSVYSLDRRQVDPARRASTARCSRLLSGVLAPASIAASAFAFKLIAALAQPVARRCLIWRAARLRGRPGARCRAVRPQPAGRSSTASAAATTTC